MKIIKVGDTVSWRGSWGSHPPRAAKVIHIEKTEQPRQKYGESVDSIKVTEKSYAVFILDNGHWAYGDQIRRIEDEPEAL